MEGHGSAARYRSHAPPFFIRPKDTKPRAFGNDTAAVAALIADDMARRRRVLEAVVDLIGDKGDAFLLAVHQSPLATREDFAWLLRRAQDTQPPLCESWARLAFRAFDWASQDHVDKWLAVRETPIVAKFLNFAVFTVLNSRAAREERRDYLANSNRPRRRTSRRPALDRPPAQIVKEAAEIDRSEPR